MSRYFNASEPVRKILQNEPQMERLVSAFGTNFRANHCRLNDGVGQGSCSYLFLLPDRNIAEQFNLQRELLCVVADTALLDSRTFDYIEGVLNSHSSRLESDVFFIVSDATNTGPMSSDYMERKGVKVVACSWNDIRGAHAEFAYDRLRKLLYTRDLFDVSDPVSSDGQFFARYKFVDDIYDTLQTGQNCGVFGLRKVGKTSVLERLKKKNDQTGRFRIAHIDAQGPEIYANSAAGVALEICKAFNRSWAQQHGGPFRPNVPSELPLLAAARFFREFVQNLSKQGKPLLLIIDELERILPSRTRLSQWNAEYVDLWRLLRSESQNMTSQQFVFLVASTNPYFIEASKFGDEDNPLYRFIRPSYLPMFSADDLKAMLGRLGRPMEISFESGAIDEIHAEFGGHPLLSRQLSSFIAKSRAERPLNVSKNDVAHAQADFRGSARNDMDAILKVFSDYYPDEYELLKALLNDERGALEKLEEQPLAAKHLLGYGLLQRTKHSYRFTMAALPHYLTTAPPTGPRPVETPGAATDRHLRLQELLNKIEPALRALVMNQLKGKFGKDWQAEMARHLKDDSLARIESLGLITGQQFMEEAYFPDILKAVLANWKLFEPFFESRDKFKGQMRYMEAARSMADHRKYAELLDDVKFIPAIEAAEWLRDSLLN